MNEQIKAPKGIKIIAGLMFIIGLIMTFLQIGFLAGTVPLKGSESYKIVCYASAIAEATFIGPLFIIAGIGLWKIKEWGLFIALIAFGARISMDVIWTPMYIMFARDGATTYDVIWDIITICIVIFAIISIVYFWRNKKGFV
ncbi:MAG: hypothetical protein ACOYWZ_02555 [Bacillota bacterium]